MGYLMHIKIYNVKDNFLRILPNSKDYPRLSQFMNFEVTSNLFNVGNSSGERCEAHTHRIYKSSPYHIDHGLPTFKVQGLNPNGHA